MLGGLGAGLARTQAAEVAQLALELVGLTSLVDMRARTLSGGELQRLAIARAACLHRPFVLADEPTGALDAATTSVVMDAFVAVARRGTGVVIATHDEVVAQMSDRTIELHMGRCRAVQR